MLGRAGEALQAIVATLWVGGMWVVGYVVAPLLFSRLGDRALAGLLAGKLFSLVAWIGLFSAVYLLLFRIARYRTAVLRQTAFWVVLLMLVLVCAGEFGVQPVMAALKAEALPRQVMDSLLRDRFVAWHGVSSVLYVIQSVLGAILVVSLSASKK